MERKGRANRRLALVLIALSVASALHAQVPETHRHEIDRIIGAKGVFVPEEGVYKVVLPREAATIVLDYQTLPPTMGLNTWAAFSPAIHHGALLTGQFLLLEDEVDPVLTTALDAGLEITGLADSSFLDGPNLKVLDVSGVGTYQHLATAFHNVLDTIQRTAKARATGDSAKARPMLSLDSSITPGPVDEILAMRGVVANGVYRAAIGRKGTIYGETAGREMGLSTWISLSGTDGHALAHGEIIATTDELQVVLRGLRTRGFHVISIRNHMAGEHPEFHFVRFWKEGRAVDSAQSLRNVLEAQIVATPSPSFAKAQ